MYNNDINITATARKGKGSFAYVIYAILCIWKKRIRVTELPFL